MAISRPDGRLPVGSIPTKVPTCVAYTVARNATSSPSATAERTIACQPEEIVIMRRISRSIASESGAWWSTKGKSPSGGEQLVREL
jgi:hypothetical protein